MHDGITTADIDLPDACLLYGEDQMFDGQATQLRPGNPRTRAKVIHCLGMQLWLYAIVQPYRVTHALTQDAFDLAIAVQLEAPALHNGVTCEAGACIELNPHQQVEQLVQPGLILEVVTDRCTAIDRGWSSGQGAVGRLHSQVRQRLNAVASKVYAAPAPETVAIDRASTPMECRLFRMVENLLDAGGHAPTMSSEVELSRNHSRHIVTQATGLLPDCELDDTISVPALARLVNVSERTLYRAFSTHLGVSPYKYILCWRLHRLRRLLLSAPGDDFAVTTAASHSGFNHLGEMGQHYRRAFGETPSETLFRSRQQRSLFGVQHAETLFQ